MSRTLCILCSLVAVACGGSRALRPVPVRVDAGAVEGPRSLRRPVVEALRATFDRSPLFTVDPDGAQVAATIVRTGNGADDRLHLAVRVPAGPGAENLRARVEVTTDQARPLNAEDAKAAAERSVAVLEARRLLATGERRHVGSVLASSDPQLQALALEWIRDHAARAFVDATPVFLASEDPAVVRLAAEVVGAAGDHAYVGVLASALGRADRGGRLAIYEALGRVGGERARRILHLARTHEEDGELAAAAERALERALGARSSHLALAEGGTSVRRGHR